MNFQDLHELLRLEVLRRIERGALTGTRLAQQTGFRQAHISNFLNRRRALSLDGLDRVLAAQKLGVDQLLPLGIAASADWRSSGLPASERTVSEGDDLPSPDACVAVPVVSLSAAVEEAQIQPANVIDTAHLSTSQLTGNRARISRRHADWQRFVAIRANSQEAEAMHPVFAVGALAVIDRHYNSIAPYHANQPTLLAMRYGSSLLLRFAELDGSRLILRPSSAAFPLHSISIAAHETASEYVVGRVCLLVQEL